MRMRTGGGGDGPRQGIEPGSKPARRVALLHLLGLSAFALAQPVFEILKTGPESLLEWGAGRWEVVAFALVLVLGPPALLFALELLAGIASRRLERVLHLLFVAGLSTLIVFQVANQAISAGAALSLLAALGGAALAYAYARSAALRSFATLLSPAPILFLVSFLFFSPLKQLTLGSDPEVRTSAATSSRTPVVLVVFDELPTLSLQNARAQLDTARYPAFAQLARQGTWYRHATTVSDSTPSAVPAILTGERARYGEMPVVGAHPDNLFTLLGPSHRMNVLEPNTHLCPRTACSRWVSAGFLERFSNVVGQASAKVVPEVFPPGVRRLGPKLQAALASEAITARGETVPNFNRFIASMESSRRPSLNFFHVQLPHSPWQYWPSGKRYTTRGLAFNFNERWTGDAREVEQHYWRHLLQVGTSDRLLGRLLDRLRRIGIYDRALIVVTADHGASFHPGESRRAVKSANVEGIAPVPLFVKAPGQRRGRIVDTDVRSIDIVPTIADILGIRVPWKTDGRSALQPQRGSRGPIEVLRALDRSDVRFRIGAGRLWRRVAVALRRQAALFGSGRQVRPVGPHRELLGKPIHTLATTNNSQLHAQLNDSDQLRAVDPGSSYLPSLISGRLTGSSPAGHDLAIAVNGRIAATTRSYRLAQNANFEALLPENALRKGPNRVQIYAIEANRLALLGS